MSVIKVSNISNVNGDSGPIISGITTVSGSGEIKLPVGNEIQKVGIESGSIRYSQNFNLIEFYDGTEWKYLTESSTPSSSVAIFAGGYEGHYDAPSAKLDYVSLVTSSNMQEFGTLERPSLYSKPASSTTTLFNPTGYNWYASNTNSVEYVSFSTKGNGKPFCQLSSAGHTDGMGSSTRGVFGGASGENAISYITFASKSDGQYFGDLYVGGYCMASMSSPTRGIFAAGANSLDRRNLIDYVTIASAGNATVFGTATAKGFGATGGSSSTRGLWTSFANTYYKRIDYITIATTGSANNFGSARKARIGQGSASSNTRVVFGGGYSDYGNDGVYYTMEYVTISSLGDAEYFGDMSRRFFINGANSNNHGGLQ